MPHPNPLSATPLLYDKNWGPMPPRQAPAIQVECQLAYDNLRKAGAEAAIARSPRAPTSADQQGNGDGASWRQCSRGEQQLITTSNV